MEAYDDSLKYLISEASAEFFRFGLGTPELEVYGPVETALPSPGSRDRGKPACASTLTNVNFIAL